ncbi:IgG-binding virulence factor TspB family protein [Neisseria gonorrhoeae]|uniref:IgG-binding virulence factor TspB family protein n=1 Tax=Neisseria gonorrhoeae TaxID=485 RepID=UPI00387B6D8A
MARGKTPQTTRTDENPGTRPNPEPDRFESDANPDTDGQPGTSPDSRPFPDRQTAGIAKKKETRRRRRAFVRLFSGNPSLSGDGQTFGPHVSRYKHTAGYRR